ncbi:MAG: hypothetical protein Q4G39_09220 [Brachymonas sp.]|nr:hypothetical protein [Brachymonas sp.]
MRVFYTPVALTPYEVKDIARALLTVTRAPAGERPLDWCRAPIGISPDLYLSHLRNVDLAEDEEGDGCHFGQTSNRHLQRVVLDAQGLYQGKPVALLGEDEMAHHTWRLEDDTQAEQLRHLLREAVGTSLSQVDAQFALASRLVALRRYWNSHHLLWQGAERDTPLAVVTVRSRKAWWQSHLQAADFDKAKIRMVRYDKPLDFAPEDSYAPLSFWQLLWDYVQRCALTEVHLMLPLPYWDMPVRVHRVGHLPQQGVGDVAVRILHTLKEAPVSINSLLPQLACDPEDGLRTLVGLLFIRVVTFEKTSPLADAMPQPSQIQAATGFS